MPAPASTLTSNALLVQVESSTEKGDLDARPWSFYIC